MMLVCGPCMELIRTGICPRCAGRLVLITDVGSVKLLGCEECIILIQMHYEAITPLTGREPSWRRLVAVEITTTLLEALNVISR